MEVVNPADFVPHIIVWSCFLFTGLVSLTALLIVSLFIGITDFNPLLVYLEAIFIISDLTGSTLIWTGNAMNPNPPYATCLATASFTMSNTPAMAGVACSLVVQVSVSVLTVYHPRAMEAFGWITDSRLLFALPIVISVPIFFASLAFGLQHPDKVLRGSPFYCTFDSDILNIISPASGGILTMTCLILAGWTSVQLSLTHRRIRSQSTEIPSQQINYGFVLRVLLFSLVVLMAFILAIISITDSFSAVVPDLFFSTCSLAALIIFGSARPIVEYVFRCRRPSHLVSSSANPLQTVGTVPVFRSPVVKRSFDLDMDIDVELAPRSQHPDVLEYVTFAPNARRSVGRSQEDESQNPHTATPKLEVDNTNSSDELINEKRSEMSTPVTMPDS